MLLFLHVVISPPTMKALSATDLKQTNSYNTHFNIFLWIPQSIKSYLSIKRFGWIWASVVHPTLTALDVECFIPKIILKRAILYSVAPLQGPYYCCPWELPLLQGTRINSSSNNKTTVYPTSNYKPPTSTQVYQNSKA